MYFAFSEGEKTVCIVQVLLKKIPLIGTLSRINRGPLILDDVSSLEEDNILLRSIETIIQECKKRKWRMLQIAPEIKCEEETQKSLMALGFKKQTSLPWSSGLLSLKPEEEEILMALNGKWRNCLRKGIKLGVKVCLASNSKANLKKVIEIYKNLQKEKNFKGLSEPLIRSLFQQSHQSWKFNIFTAHASGKNGLKKDLGTLVSVSSGNTSIYLVGATPVEGRKFQSNYVLLWQAILEAKNRGCEWFDIGGLDESSHKGIAHFKKGLQAKPYSLIGEWRIFFVPKLFKLFF